MVVLEPDAAASQVINVWRLSDIPIRVALAAGITEASREHDQFTYHVLVGIAEWLVRETFKADASSIEITGSEFVPIMTLAALER